MSNTTKQNSSDSAFEQRKNQGKEFLQYALNTRNDVSFDVFKTRIEQAVQIYAQALLVLDHKVNLAEVASINKNKSLCYKKLLENFRVTGQDSTNSLVDSLKHMIRFQSMAISIGKGYQTEEWYVEILKQSSFIFENKIVSETLKSLQVKERIDVYESLLHIVSPLNFDLVRRLSWTLSKLNFKQSIVSHDTQKFQIGINQIQQSINFLVKKSETDLKIIQDPLLDHYNYAADNPFIDDETTYDFKKELDFQNVLLNSKNELSIGIKTFNDSLQEEHYAEDKMYDAIDSINLAMKRAFEIDIETEALCSAHLGKIYYRGLKNHQKGKQHYNDCIRILETLKPRVFNEEKWHQLMVKHMVEIQQAQNQKEESERQESEQEIRNTVQKQLDELKENSESSAKFLLFVGEKYSSYVTGKTVSFTSESLESKNIKKTLNKTCLHYHSDKSAKAKANGMSEAQIYLRSEIIKIITGFINEMKSCDLPDSYPQPDPPEEEEKEKETN